MRMASVGSASTEEIRRRAEALISCAICTEPFTNPKVLTCQHTFCINCLRQFYDSCNQQRVVKLSNFPCPECRRVIYLPSGGLDCLPNDFKISQIRDFLDKLNLGDEGKDSSLCDVCRHEEIERTAASYCVSCAKNLCETCNEHHTNVVLFKDHKTISIESRKRSASECQQHHEELKYYCLQCAAPLCTVCALSKHAKHETTSLEEALSTQRATIQHYMSEVHHKMSQSEQFMDEAGYVKESLYRDYTTIQQSIKHHVSAVQESIKSQEKQLLDQLDTEYQDNLQQVRNLHSQTEGMLKQMNLVCMKAIGLTEPTQAISLLREGSVLTEQLKEECQRGIPQIPKHLKQGSTFMPNSGFEIGSLTRPVRDTTSSILKSSNALVPAEAPRDLRFDFSGLPELSPVNSRPSFVHKNLDMDLIQSSIVSQFNYNIQMKWKAKYFYDNKDVTFLPNGNLAATDYKNGGDRVKIYNKSGKLCQWVQGNSRSIIKPWGITLNKDTNQLVITDHGDSSVKILDAQLEVADVWRGRFVKPCGIAISQSGLYVVSDVGSSSRYKLGIFSPTGVCTRELAEHGQDMANLLSPNYIAIDNHDRILVSDCQNHCVKAFDQQGHTLLQFGAEGTNGQPMYPQGLWVDSQNNILVVDQSCGSLSMYSSDGQYIQTVGMLEGTLWGMAGFKDQLLAVCNEQALEIFQLNH